MLHPGSNQDTSHGLCKGPLQLSQKYGQWGDKSPNDEKNVAKAAEINALKGRLKLDPKLGAIAKDMKKYYKGENQGFSTWQ